MGKRILPVGNDNFQMIREEGFYYVDKTKFISDLIRARGMVNLFTRPRRFGKTLIISMLKSFFEIGSDPELFHGLAIEQDTEVCEKYQGKYPVVSISLKGIEGRDYKDALNNLREQLSVMAQEYEYLLDSELVSVMDKERLKNIIYLKADETLTKHALTTLMRMLHAHYGRKVILLIDEYDVPLDRANLHGYYNEMVLFLRVFFGEAFKTNPNLELAVITGCLRISKESIFTGINNLKVDGISNHHFGEYFGFTDENVKMILEDYSLSSAYEEMREWYDGYHFGDTDVYCPWDVISHCDKLLGYPYAEPEAYWNNTSSNGLVKLFIDKADDNTRETIGRLIAGEATEQHLTENLTYAEIEDSIEHLWSVLYLTGYLTKDRKKNAEKQGCVRLVIPNKEVRTIFEEKIQKWFDEKVRRPSGLLHEMHQALIRGEAETAESIISSQLRYAISYFDQKEDFYHGFLVGLLVSDEEWRLRSNREMGIGRSDIMLESYGRGFGIVIEIKRAEKAAELEAKCEEALRQIEEKRYAEELMVLKNTVWGYGIAFAEKQCRMTVKKLK